MDTMFTLAVIITIAAGFFLLVGIIADAPTSRAEAKARMNDWYERLLDEADCFVDELYLYDRSAWVDPWDSLPRKAWMTTRWLAFRVEGEWLCFRLRLFRMIDPLVMR